MAYTVENFKTKKALKDAVARSLGETIHRQPVRVFQPGPYGPEVRDGEVSLEGPHYPAPHTWGAVAVVKDGVIVKVKS